MAIIKLNLDCELDTNSGDTNEDVSSPLCDTEELALALTARSATRLRVGPENAFCGLSDDALDWLAIDVLRLY